MEVAEPRICSFCGTLPVIGGSVKVYIQRSQTMSCHHTTSRSILPRSVDSPSSSSIYVQKFGFRGTPWDIEMYMAFPNYASKARALTEVTHRLLEYRPQANWRLHHNILPSVRWDGGEGKTSRGRDLIESKEYCCFSSFWAKSTNFMCCRLPLPREDHLGDCGPCGRSRTEFSP